MIEGFNTANVNGSEEAGNSGGTTGSGDDGGGGMWWYFSGGGGGKAIAAVTEAEAHEQGVAGSNPRIPGFRFSHTCYHRSAGVMC